MHIANNQSLKLPTVICSTVLRNAKAGDNHGYLYLVDLENASIKKSYSFSDKNISWEGRGGDRGLRGIAFYKDNVLVAASKTILFFNKDLELVKELTNPFLSSCHEISVQNNLLYISSTNCGAVVVYDLEDKNFITSYFVQPSWFKIFRPLMKSFATYVRKFVQYTYWGWSLFWKIRTFDPNSKNLDNRALDVLHLNNVFIKSGKIYFSGTTLPHLFSFSENNLKTKQEYVIERQTHDPQIVEDKLFFNATRNDRVVVQNLHNNKVKSFSVPKYDSAQLKNAHYDSHKAKQSFARGLTVFDGRYVIAGSSPATLSVYDIKNKRVVKTVQLSNDVCEAVHGLEKWPF